VAETDSECWAALPHPVAPTGTGPSVGDARPADLSDLSGRAERSCYAGRAGTRGGKADGEEHRPAGGQQKILHAVMMRQWDGVGNQPVAHGQAQEMPTL
jgi:hypothetical protein